MTAIESEPIAVRAGQVFECIVCRLEGMIRGRGLCIQCHADAKQRDELSNFPRVTPEPKKLIELAELYPRLRQGLWSHRDIAAHLGVSLDTFQQRLHRARRRGLLPAFDASRDRIVPMRSLAS